MQSEAQGGAVGRDERLNSWLPRIECRIRGHMITKTALIWMAATIALWAFPTASRAKIVDRIIARVNGEIITQKMFEREQVKLRAQLAQEYSGAELEQQFREKGQDLLRDLIDQSLMVQKAKDLDINVETDVVKRLDELRKEFNLSSLEALQTEVEKQGLNWEDFKDQIRRQLLMREVIGREVGRTLQITRQDARKYYEAHKNEFQSPGGVHLAIILVSTEKRKPDEAEKRAKDALAEIKAGTRFADVAKKYSDDGSASEGGDVGFLKKGTLDPVLEGATDKLELGDTSDLIQTKHGYTILKVLEKLRPGIPAFEEVEQRVNDVLYNQRMQPGMRKYLTTLRKESFIYLASGYVDSGAERPSQADLTKKGQ